MISILLGLLIAITWGLAPVLQKQVLNNISPITTMLLINLIITILLIILSLTYYKNQIQSDLQNISYKNLQIISFVAVICGFIPGIIYYIILDKWDSSRVVITTSLYPIFTLIFANLILNETIPMELYIITLIISIIIIKYIPTE